VVQGIQRGERKKDSTREGQPLTADESKDKRVRTSARKRKGKKKNARGTFPQNKKRISHYLETPLSGGNEKKRWKTGVERGKGKRLDPQGPGHEQSAIKGRKHSKGERGNTEIS